MIRTFIAAITAASLVPLGACKRVEPESQPAATGSSTADRTLAGAIAAAPQMKNFAGALKDTGLAGALDGAAPYTLLAPVDAAFSRLGQPAVELRKPEHQAAMAEILRDHVIPGYLTPRDIQASIAANDGKPVKMRTAGDGQVTFTRDGETLTITSADGVTGRIAGEPLRASNGAAIPIDTVLRKLAEG